MHFQHQGRFRHRAEQRVKRLTGLEVDRPVLHLQQHIVAELAVKRLELAIGLLRAVVGLILRIHESAPHDDAAVRRYGVGEHVGAVRVRATVVLRTRLALGVGLDQEAAEIGDVTVDLLRLGAPPRADRRIEGIGRLEAADFDGRAEAGAQVDAHAVWPQDIRQRRRLLQITRCENEGARIDVREDRAVNADRSTRTRVVRVPGINVSRQCEPIPDRAARIAALDRFVQVVPMIENPTLQVWRRGQIEVIERLTGLQEAQ